MMLFIFDGNRTLTHTVKGRINILVADDLEHFAVSVERVVMDVNGNELAVIPGVLGAGKRISIEGQKTPIAPAAPTQLSRR